MAFQAWFQRLLAGVGHQHISMSDKANSLFNMLYGRQANASEAPALDCLAKQFSNDTVRLLRGILGNNDRQRLGTAFLVRFSEMDVQYAQLDGFDLALDMADAAVSQPIQALGTYEPHLTQFIRRRLQKGMTFVDVGANIGYYTLLASTLVGSQGQVIAFEPNSENCRLILLSVTRNKVQNVRLIPVALSTQLGNAYFSTHIGSNGGLLPTTEQTLLNPNSVVVPTMRLDDLVHHRVDLIKVDTEGAEGLVLGGAKRLMETYRPVMVCEFSPEMLSRVSHISGEAYLSMFEQLGYDIYLIDRQSGDLQPVLDIGSFLASYGSIVRIEDMVFTPRMSGGRRPT